MLQLAARVPAPNLACLQELEDSSGVGGRKDILPIKNLSSETAPTVEARVLVCRALQQALYAAVDYFRECAVIEMTDDDELASISASETCAQCSLCNV